MKDSRRMMAKTLYSLIIDLARLCTLDTFAKQISNSLVLMMGPP